MARSIAEDTNLQPRFALMKNDKRTEYLTRDSLLKLLSDAEVASVSTAETAPSLANGDEYLDLEQLERGVLTAPAASATPMGRVLPKKAVRETTWAAILAQLPASTAATTQPLR